MAKGRFVLHPVLENRRSRYIFLWFLIVSNIVGLASYWKFNLILKNAELSHLRFQLQKNILLDILLSPQFQYALIVAVALIAGGLTAYFVVGPVRRIEQWILDWEAGRDPQPLKVRKHDKYLNFVRLLNELKSKL